MKQETPEPELSVVIPAYNEAQRIDRTLRSSVDYLDRNHPHFELIVVDDGSRDDTCSIAMRYVEEDPRVRLCKLGYNRGKGAAVRHGVLKACGKHILYMDADLATPLQELEKLYTYAHQGVEVVFGSRGHPSSQVRRSQNPLRQNMGRTFNILVQTFVLQGVYDTQCGFKLLSRHAAHDIFSHAIIDRFAFDVEVLVIALERGFRIQEVPIEWCHDPQSHVSPVTDAARMLWDMLRTRARIRKRIATFSR